MKPHHPAPLAKSYACHRAHARPCLAGRQVQRERVERCLESRQILSAGRFYGHACSAGAHRPAPADPAMHTEALFNPPHAYILPVPAGMRCAGIEEQRNSRRGCVFPAQIRTIMPYRTHQHATTTDSVRNQSASPAKACLSPNVLVPERPQTEPLNAASACWEWNALKLLRA